MPQRTKSPRHNQNQHVEITIRINMFKFTIRDVLNYWVVWKKRGNNVTYCTALPSGTSPPVRKDDIRTGHTVVLQFPRDDFPILRLSPVQEVLSSSLLHYCPHPTLPLSQPPLTVCFMSTGLQTTCSWHEQYYLTTFVTCIDCDPAGSFLVYLAHTVGHYTDSLTWSQAAQCSLLCKFAVSQSPYIS